jgi:hypothetical protein
MELFNEWPDFLNAFWSIHQPSIPSGQDASFTKKMQGQTSEGIEIGPLKQGISINLFLADFSGFSVYVSDGIIHGLFHIVCRKPPSMTLNSKHGKIGSSNKHNFGT